MTDPDHTPCWHLRVLPHPPPRHGPHAERGTIAVSEPPTPKDAVCCWCGRTVPYESVMIPLPTSHTP